MGAGVSHAVGRVVMRQIQAIGAVQTELQHLHAGESAFRQQHTDGIKNFAQILGHNGQVTQSGAQSAEQVHAGALFPLAAAGVFVPRRDSPIGIKAAEVVNTQDIINAQRMAHAAHPPGIVGTLVVGPVIQRVAPQLAILGKIVRRAASHAAGVALAVHLKQLTACPRIGRIRRHIDGNIAHDLDALAVGICFQGLPLLGELILHKGPEAQFIGMAGAELFQRLGVAQAQRGRPGLPVAHLVFFFDCHVQAVIWQPGIAQKGKTVPVIAVGGIVPRHRALLQKCGVCLAQHLVALLVQQGIVTVIGVGAPIFFGVIFRLQQAIRSQLIQVNKIRVARKSRAALVRAVAIRSRANGQDLPHALSGQRQKIHKISGSLAHGANAIPARQAGNRHQDTAATLLHFFSSP